MCHAAVCVAAGVNMVVLRQHVSYFIHQVRRPRDGGKNTS
jgi:hypothetical protein